MSKIVFLGAGGTIAGTALNSADNVGYKPAQIGVDQLLRQIPLLHAAVRGFDVESEQVVQIDSKDMDFQHWMALARSACRCLASDDVTGLVITHGTDTLEETAYFLSRVLPRDYLARKPVVLTCAMRPASSVLSDGPQNILDAVAVVCSQGSKGVVVVCAGEVHSAAHVQKVHPYRLNAFDSGDAGPLGYVEEGVLRLTQGWPDTPSDQAPISLERMATATWPRVEIVMSYVGATGATVRALCDHAEDGAGPVRGIVVAGTGNGSIHTDLQAALCTARAQGVEVVRATRCAWGAVVPGSVPTNAFPHSNGLSPVKARIALMLDLMK